MKTIIAASNNHNKILEIKAILNDLDYKILSLKEAGIQIDPEETASDFEGNAIIKAKAAAYFSKSTILADDSGLMVDCLNGLPGVKSKRFAGENVSDKDNNTYLIECLKQINSKKFTAKFVCTIALLESSGRIKIFKGVCKGEIILDSKGSGGFGYDPIFYIPNLKKTMAQLTDNEKNSISHRGKALSKLKKYLESKSI